MTQYTALQPFWLFVCLLFIHYSKRAKAKRKERKKRNQKIGYLSYKLDHRKRLDYKKRERVLQNEIFDESFDETKFSVTVIRRR